MRHRFTFLAGSLGIMLIAAPVAGQSREIQICVIEGGSARQLTAQFNPASGDTTIAGRRFVGTPGGYSANAPWFQEGAQLDYDGSAYEKYGLPRVLGVNEVLPVGEFRGVTIFAEAAGAHDTPEVVYIPVRPGCEFQPYALIQEPVPAAGRSASGSVGRIDRNDSVSGNLSPSDPTANDNSHYDDYIYTAGAGERVTIGLAAPEFDAYLAVGRGVGDGFDAADSNDDGPDMGTNSQIEYVFEEAGDYTIRANSLNQGETGYYVLTVSTTGSASGSEPSRTAIRAGQTLKGALSARDATLPDGSFYDHFLYQASAGERVTVTLEADAFDAFLVVGREPKGIFEELDSNDDGVDTGTDSQLEITFPAAGEYILRANSLGAGETGAYTMTIRPLP